MYKIKLEQVCKNQRFQPEEVVQSLLVFPKGAVPNPQILWVRIDLKNGERKFVTLPLQDFYEYIELPSSSIGGWTEGEIGTDEAGMRAHLAKYKHGGDGQDIQRSDTGDEDHHPGSDAEVSDHLLDSAKGAEGAVGAELPES